MSYQHKPFDTQMLSAEQLWLLTSPHRFYFSPTFYNLENFDPHKPTLMVGNHTIYGVIDVPLLIAQLYKETGVLVRSLADHAHYKVPVWRSMLDQIGSVEGTRENCARLMENGEHVLVFPGGAREVSKRKGEQYQLTWKQRTGFCRMAIEHGYNILPFASVGPDDMYDILLDAEDIKRSPLGGLLNKAGLLKKDSILRGGDLIMPITRGIGLSVIPRPEPFYFSLGKEIDVSSYAGKENDQEALLKLREKVSFSIQDLIGDLMVKREHDHRPGLLRKIINKL